MEGFAYFVKIAPDGNQNRYYRMERPGSADYFLIEMGRIGAAPVRLKRPMALWQDTYQKKLKEGYVDRSPYMEVEVISGYREISDPDVKELFDALQEYADYSLEEHYSISYQEVTGEMLKQAEDCLSLVEEHLSAGSGPDTGYCNRELLHLFAIIPRKMKDVSGMLVKSRQDIPVVLGRERQLLDVMRAKVSQDGKLRGAAKGETMLDALGLRARRCTRTEEAQIRKHMASESSGYFRRAFRVRNQERDKAFWAYCSAHGISQNDIHYYYHGSKNMNYMGIITEGLSLNPNAPITGKMFGHGIYFANRAKKSINYTDIMGSYYAGGSSRKAYLAVYKVAYKNPLHRTQWEPWMGNIRTTEELKGHDALYAHAGGSLYNDEVIVYNEDQATMQYLIELAA